MAFAKGERFLTGLLLCISGQNKVGREIFVLPVYTLEGTSPSHCRVILGLRPVTTLVVTFRSGPSHRL